MEEDNLRQAEHYFIEGGDWKQCINMYRQRDMWDEAYRVNKPEKYSDHSFVCFNNVSFLSN